VSKALNPLLFIFAVSYSKITSSLTLRDIWGQGAEENILAEEG
jgi:hypothetical protein